MRTSKFLGVVGAFVFALSLGAPHAGASTQNAPGGISQTGANSNQTTQKAKSEAETEQKNFNVPLSFLSLFSNNGDVHQYNRADTSAWSSNDNSTQQVLVQDQSVKDTGYRPSHDCRCNSGDMNRGDKQRGDKHQNCGCESGDKHRGDKGDKYQGDKNRGDKHQGCGCESGDKHRGDKGDKHQGDKNRGDKHQSCGCRPGAVSQYGSNDNSTSQDAKSQASTEQTNVNIPISVLSAGSNNGDVTQGNEADTSAKSSNSNWTDQGVSQDQQVSGNDSNCGPGQGDVSQSGENQNSTDQKASSEATTKQLNVNAPISILSFGSNNGDVHQGNQAGTYAGSSNSNGTSQLLGQSQGTGLPLGL